MPKNNLFTPDRPINPPEDKETKMTTCWECNGTRETVYWDDDDNPQPITCHICKGLGSLEIDDDDLDEDLGEW